MIRLRCDLHAHRSFIISAARSAALAPKSADSVGFGGLRVWGKQGGVSDPIRCVISHRLAQSSCCPYDFNLT